jgi:isochorismate pyruvate lyase
VLTKKFLLKGTAMKKCNSLQEVRDEIDKIDMQLVDLISERSHLIRQAAAFKNSVDEVKAEDRIDDIMQRVRKRAIELNINPNMISELFTIMIDEMVETEISEFRNDGKF